MVITSIEVQAKDERRRSVYIDGEFAFGLSDVDVLFYKLKEYDEISQEKYDEIMNNVIMTKARESAVRFLGYRARSKKEIREKLREKEYSDDVIEKTIEFLEKYNYVNDKQFAIKYMNDKIKLKGNGVNKIKYELRQKGIDDEILDEVFVDTYDDELEKAIKLLEKKVKCIDELDYKAKQKLSTYLNGRGYSYDIIKASIKHIEDTLED